MIEALGERQQSLLRLLQRDAGEATVDNLAQRLEITRNAVRQHLAVLERDGLVVKGGTQATGGRPEQFYTLSPRGREYFPRRYTWFAEALLESLVRESGAKGLRKRLERMGRSIAADLKRRTGVLPNRPARVRALAGVMNELGYDVSKVTVESGTPPMIEARNCVFHLLAEGQPEVCHFDLALLGEYTECSVEHAECMVRGGHVCRFLFHRPGAKPEGD